MKLTAPPEGMVYKVFPGYTEDISYVQLRKPVTLKWYEVLRGDLDYKIIAQVHIRVPVTEELLEQAFKRLNEEAKNYKDNSKFYGTYS